jgi:hypothetical protein
MLGFGGAPLACSVLLGRELDGHASLVELNERIAIVRGTIRGLTERAAALSGAGDETRIADRIADQERLLAELLKERESRLK